jgi:hypothetical protein
MQWIFWTLVHFRQPKIPAQKFSKSRHHKTYLAVLDLFGNGPIAFSGAASGFAARNYPPIAISALL